MEENVNDEYNIIYLLPYVTFFDMCDKLLVKRA